MNYNVKDQTLTVIFCLHLKQNTNSFELYKKKYMFTVSLVYFSIGEDLDKQYSIWKW